MERRFEPDDLAWFWYGCLGGSVRSGLVIEAGQGLSSGPSAFSCLVARGDLDPEWMREELLSERSEDGGQKSEFHR